MGILIYPDDNKNSTQVSDDELTLSRYIVDYEFHNPKSKYSSEHELIKHYAKLIKQYAEQESLKARLEERQDVANYNELTWTGEKENNSRIAEINAQLNQLEKGNEL